MILQNATLKEVLKHEGIVSITTWANGEAHVSNTWNSYVDITDDDRLLIPAAWMHTTEKNINSNNHVIITLGSHEVQGKLGMGTGFVIKGSAHFISQGPTFDAMKVKFSFTSRVLEIHVTSLSQTI